MKPSSAKNKGRAHQQATRDLLLAASGGLLGPRDVESTSMGANGADVKLSSAAFSEWPFSIECKSVAAFQGYTYFDQAQEHSDKYGGIPLVVVKANFRNPVVILDLEDFIDLLQTAKEAVC
jgi:hypothetical protein